MRFVNTVYAVNAVLLQAEICLLLFISNLQHHKSNIDHLPLKMHLKMISKQHI